MVVEAKYSGCRRLYITVNIFRDQTQLREASLKNLIRGKRQKIEFSATEI